MSAARIPYEAAGNGGPLSPRPARRGALQAVDAPPPTSTAGQLARSRSACSEEREAVAESAQPGELDDNHQEDESILNAATGRGAEVS